MSRSVLQIGASTYADGCRKELGGESMYPPQPIPLGDPRSRRIPPLGHVAPTTLTLEKIAPESNTLGCARFRENWSGHSCRATIPCGQLLQNHCLPERDAVRALDQAFERRAAIRSR